MPRHSSLHLYDALLGGALKRMLTDWRDEDPPVPFDEIAYRLRGHDINVASETVRRWVKTIRLENAKPERAAS